MGLLFRKNKWMSAAGIVFSTIVGAGVLSLPYIVSQIGIFLGSIYIVAMGLVMCGVHLLVAEIVIHTRRHLQLTGIIRKYIGKRSAFLMAIVFIILHIGAMTAYIIGEGESLAAVFGGSSFAWAILFFVIGSAIILNGVKAISKFDFWMSVLTIIVIGLIVVMSAPLASDWLYEPTQFVSLLIPYGVLLFAFHGSSSIPETEMITGTDAHALRRAVLVGSLIPVALYTVFAVTVVAVTGGETTEIATIGLGEAVGPHMVLIGNIFAIIAMSSSFVTIGQALRRSYEWDYGLPAWAAIFGSIGVPFLIYLFGAREFIQVIAIVGAGCGTIEILLLLVAYWNMRRGQKTV